MKKISNWLKQNPMLKLASLILAFIIWLTVVNFSNPEMSDYVTVELDVRNGEELISADQMYSLDTRSVRVSFNVRARYMNQISASDFTAYVDLKDYSITGAVPVYIEPSSEIASLISDVTSNPMVVHVSTEDMQEKRFDLEVRLVGEQAEGYALGEALLSQDYVYVSGPVSEVGMISSVGIEIDVNGASDTLTGTAPVVFYDANGNAMQMDDRLTVSAQEVDYTKFVYRIKSLGISTGTVGEPAEGYLFEGVETSPSFVSVYGSQDLLNSYSSIQIPDEAIDISGATRDVTLTIDITPYIPAGLVLSETSSQITAVARIRRAPETSEAEEEGESGSEAQETADPTSPGDSIQSSESPTVSASGHAQDQSTEAATAQTGLHEDLGQNGISETGASTEQIGN